MPVLGEKNVNQRNKMLKNELKKTSEEFFSTTSIHGFGSVLRSTNLLITIIWIVFLILFTGYTMYLTYSSIEQFFRFEKQTDQSTVIETSSEFPAVTMCNLNAFNLQSQTNARSNYLDKILVDFNFNFSTSSSSSATTLKMDEYKKLIKILKTIVASEEGNVSDSYLYNLGFDISEMLVSCDFDGQPCDSNDFKWSHDFEYGNCFTFNHKHSSVIRNATKSGPKTGLNMELFTGLQDNSIGLSMQSGVLISVHNKDFAPFTKDGVFAATGTYTNIGVERTYLTLLSSPFSDCRKNLKIVDSDSTYYKLASQDWMYDYKTCTDIYIQFDFYMKECGCMDPSLRWYNSSSVCNTISEIDCMLNLTISKLDDKLISLYCPRECDSVFYSTNLNFAAFPTEYYTKVLSNNEEILNLLNASSKNSLPPPDPNKCLSGCTTELPRPKSIKSSSVDASEISIQQPLSKKSKLQVLKNIITSGYANLGTTKPSGSGTTTKGFISTTGTTSSSGGIPPTQNNLHKSFLKVSVYYNGLKYIAINESPVMTIETLIGMIGGQFGLFLGASFLSFFELFEYLLRIIQAIVNFGPL